MDEQQVDSEDAAKADVSFDARTRSIVEYGKTVLVTLVVALIIKSFVVEAFRIPSGSMENTLLVGDFLLVNKLAYGIRMPRHVPMTNLAIPALIIPVFTGVERGDIVVFEFPGERGADGVQSNYIKRCIGLPGDTAMIRQARVFINGRELLFSRTVKFDLRRNAASSRSVTVIPGGRGFTEDDYGPVVIPKRGDVISLDDNTFEQWRDFISREGHTTEMNLSGTILIDGRSSTTYAVERDYYFMLGDNRNNSMDSRFWGFVPEENLVGEALMVYWSWDPDISLMNFLDKLGSIRWGRFGMLVR
ncbi:MAG TPA: signal peptidase I [Bacteroidota bacterium]